MTSFLIFSKPSFKSGSFMEKGVGMTRLKSPNICLTESMLSPDIGIISSSYGFLIFAVGPGESFITLYPEHGVVDVVLAGGALGLDFFGGEKISAKHHVVDAKEGVAQAVQQILTLFLAVLDCL